MGRRGPRPTPTAILETRGSTVPGRRSRRREPRPERKSPNCPRWICADARAIWKRLVPALDAAGIICRLDEFAIARYCSYMARWRRAEKVVRTKGESYEAVNVKGDALLRTRPEARTLEQLEPRLLKLEQELGLTPAARARLIVDAEEHAPKATDILTLMKAEKAG